MMIFRHVSLVLPRGPLTRNFPVPFKVIVVCLSSRSPTTGRTTLAMISCLTSSVEKVPSGENLLDKASRKKLPQLYSGEEKGLDALAQVKFFTPDSNWTW
jgi:hypothetical protein